GVAAVPAPSAGAASAALARRVRTAIAFGFMAALCAGGFVWSVSIGPEHISVWTIVKGTFAQGHETKQLIVHLIRLPRALVAGMGGGGAAVAGAVMPSLTGNPPRAARGLRLKQRGPRTGAVVEVTVPSIGGIGTIFLSLGGATLGALMVFGIARFGRGGLTPVKLALAGMTISLLFFALLQGILIAFSQNSELFFFWLVGGV